MYIKTKVEISVRKLDLFAGYTCYAVIYEGDKRLKTEGWIGKDEARLVAKASEWVGKNLTKEVRY